MYMIMMFKIFFRNLILICFYYNCLLICIVNYVYSKCVYNVLMFIMRLIYFFLLYKCMVNLMDKNIMIIV